MAPLPVIADVFRVTLNWTGSGQHGANVLHFLDDVTGQTETDLFNALNTNVTQNMWNGVHGNFAVDSLTIIKLNGTSPSVDFPTGRPSKWTGGSASGDFAVAPSIGVLIDTLQRGARGRGRIFLPFPAETAIASGFVVTSNRNTMQTAWDTWIGAMVTAEFIPGVASYAHTDFHAVATLKIRSALVTQRRRQHRVI